MPELIKLYIRSIAVGFVVSTVFLGMLLGFDLGGLRHLVVQTQGGWLAGLMIWLSNGIVFSGVQFGIAVMGMADPPDGPKGGTRAPVTHQKPALVPVAARSRRR